MLQKGCVVAVLDGLETRRRVFLFYASLLMCSYLALTSMRGTLFCFIFAVK